MHDDFSDNLLTDKVSKQFNVSTSILVTPLSVFHLPSPPPPIPSIYLPPYKILDVPDLNLVKTSLLVLIDVDVDWEMCVDVSHLVLESLCDTDDQVVDESSDCSEGSDVLAGTVVKLDIDDILLWEGEVDCQMRKVLLECSWNSSSAPPPPISCPEL